MTQALQARGRLDALDSARGFAIALMVMSHTVKGLLPFNALPDWGLVPVHLFTKFSSTLFILVFGVSVAVAYVPKVWTSQWPKARRALWTRALIVLASYKVLTVVQMFERYDRQYMIDALMFLRFTDFAEILQFYGWLLLLLPLFLPAWRWLSLWGQLGVAWSLGFIGFLLRQHFDFFGIWQLQAIWVEHDDAFCFGLLTRGPMVLVAMAFGGMLTNDPVHQRERLKTLSSAAIVLGLMGLTFFLGSYWENLGNVARALAKNYGKHPPRVIFMSFSAGGAFLLFGLLAKAKGFVHTLLWPFRVVGEQSLFCFNAHLIIVFVVFRWGMGLRHEVSYSQALVLTGANLVLCGTGAAAWGWLKRRLSPKPRLRAVTRVREDAFDAEKTDVVGQELFARVRRR
ncbi:MAG: OpgC domain-containing protein [Myxococcaceae bacterium]